MKFSMKRNCEKFLIRQKPFHLQGLILRVTVASQNGLGNVLSVSIQFEEFQYQVFFEGLIEFCTKTIWSCFGLFHFFCFCCFALLCLCYFFWGGYCGRLLMTTSISFWVVGLFSLSYPDLTLVFSICVENCPGHVHKLSMIFNKM